MGTKTISLSDDAYEQLKAKKREGESFSDVVRRLFPKVRLEEFHGALSEGTTEELEIHVEESRERHREKRKERMEEIEEKLDS
ncbi:MAG: hypothetical protein MAG715_01036 [Methanonatronarchaeales archaeon]|nr:hypothetical protein [Methanonatronarchaeales archaeon]